MASMRNRKRRWVHSRIARLHVKCLQMMRKPEAMAKLYAAIFPPKQHDKGDV